MPAALAFIRRRAPLIAWAIAIAVTMVAFARTARVAGGADTYGYVSEADLWLKGRLSVHQDFGIDPPWPAARFTLVPLAYRVKPDGYDLVPIYSPGLPLVMAAAELVGGYAAAFCVVPIAGGVLVLATFGIGRRIGRPVVGLAAAAIVATSPAVLFMLMSPMSDVPDAAAWAVAIWCVLGGTAIDAAAGGLAAALAILIRPDLVPMAGVIGLWLIARDLRGSPGAGRGDEPRRRDWRRLQTPPFAVWSAIGAVVVAVVNDRLFGSPLHSGYGNLSDIFATSHVLPNLARYPRWIATAETPLAVGGLVALAWPFVRIWPTVGARRARWLFAGATLVVWALYLAYLPFDAWWYLRFLLPTWAPMAVASASLLAVLWRAPARWMAAPLTLAAVCVHGVLFAEAHDAFRIGNFENKYYDAAHFMDAISTPNDVIFAMQDSGSLRYYGRRLTVRWDRMEQGWIDQGAAWLEARGHHVYFVLEPWEIDLLRARSGPSDALARLDWQPIASIDDGAVLVYDTKGHATPPITLPLRPLGWHFPAPAAPIHFRW